MPKNFSFCGISTEYIFMKLRTKITLFFGSFFLVTAIAVVVYVEYVVGDTFRKQIASDFFVIAEQSEGTYFAFMEGVKTRAVDWTSDVNIQNTVKGVLGTVAGTPERARFAKEFATYISERKMPYDKTIFLVDVLDRDGIVVASTRPDRIGTDELEEEVRLKAHHFSKAIVSESSEVLVRGFIFEEDETAEPMTHAAVRLFTLDKEGVFQPLDAVFLFHFANTLEIAHALGVGDIVEETAGFVTNRVSRKALLENYKTSDIYLINSDRTMVTPSRYVKDVNLHQKVDTLPVRECLENGKEISEEYEDYRGVRVFGASMCFKDDGLVLVVEAQKDELYAPLYALIRTVFVGGFTLLFFGVLVAIFFVRKPLARIGDVVSVAKRVAEGNLDAQVTVRSKDEIGYLASSFNTMIMTIRANQENLWRSRREIEEKSLVLEQDIKKHEEQERLLNESKKATLNVLEDMSQTKKKLETEGHRLQTIISSIGDGLILIDGMHRVALVNPQALNMLALPPMEVIGKDLRSIVAISKNKKTDLLPDEWPTEEMFLTKKTVNVGLDEELSLMTVRRALPLPVTLSVAPLGGGLVGGIIIIHDVTEDRALDDAKSGFISVASHQLRTPLTTIRWYSEMLLSDDAGALTPSQKDFLAEIHGGAERLYQTIDLLLGISRVESGKFKTEKEIIDLDALTREIAKDLALTMDQKKLVFTVVPPAEPVPVSLDPLQLRQVVMNLISNAVRYTNENGMIEARWGRSEDGKDVVYAVADNGIGIPKPQQSRIFTKFFRAENALQKVPDGSGLGLALVRELVESWGGHVRFETEEGKGTTFFFTIPFE